MVGAMDALQLTGCRLLSRLIVILHMTARADVAGAQAVSLVAPARPEDQLAGAHWVSINLSYRTTLDFVIEEDALLLNLGDHNGVH